MKLIMTLWKKLPLALVLFIIIFAVIARYFPTVVYLPGMKGVFPVSLPQFSPLPIATDKKEAVVFAGTAATGYTVPSGYKITTVTNRLNRPRVLAISPGGSLLVSEMGGGNISVIDSATGQAKSIISGLKSPHGIVFFGNKLFVAEEQKLNRYSWDEAAKTAKLDKMLFPLPKGGRHFTRSIAFDKEGKMYVAIGSTCDVCEETDPFLTSIVISDAEGNSPRVFSKGLRNTVYITHNSTTNQIWGTEMGRDFLGDDLPPDEVNIFKDGGNYGWPNCYGDRIFDTKGISKDPGVCASTEIPVYKILAHSAPLGLAFAPDGDLLVAYHGSWNRSSPVGYKVVKLNVEGSTVLGETDFVTGFLTGGNVNGRPAGLVYDQAGNLYLSDDQGGRIFKVSKI